MSLDFTSIRASQRNISLLQARLSDEVSERVDDGSVSSLWQPPVHPARPLSGSDSHSMSGWVLRRAMSGVGRSVCKLGFGAMERTSAESVSATTIEISLKLGGEEV